MTTKNEYARRKENGLCLQCGGTRIEGKTMCLVCLTKLAEKYRKQKQSQKCVNCGSQTEQGTRCLSCAEQQRAIATKRREARRKLGKCVRCGHPAKKKNCEKCLLIYKNQRDTWKNQGLCQSCGKTTQGKARCSSCLEINRASMNRLKIDVLMAYGGLSCSCCQENHIEFLALDHIKGGGASHRRQVSNVYRSLRKQGYPPGYQVLCHNCNWAKHAYGECPHKKESKNG